MFIIVETIEDDEITLCVVPESWEKNGILFWPPGRKGINLRKDDSVLPDFKNWSKQKCTVKRRDFITFQAAIKAERYLSQFDDTEDETNYLAQNSLQETQCSQKKYVDFNNLMVENNKNNSIQSSVIEDVNNSLPDNVATNVITNVANNVVPVSNNDLREVGHTGTIIIEADEASTISLSNYQKTLDNVQVQLNEINSKLTNFGNHVRREISALHIQFDKLINLLITNENKRIEKPEDDMLKILETDIKQMKPLATEADLNNLEKQLCNQEFELTFVKVMSEIGGTTGTKDSKKIAYLLMDRLFQRQLLTFCSWTGSTKKKEAKSEKIAFFKYNRITETIYKIIHLADSRYTIDDNSGFLKRILKNSVTRSKQLEKQQRKQNENLRQANNGFEHDDNQDENIENTEDNNEIFMLDNDKLDSTYEG